MKTTINFGERHEVGPEYTEGSTMDLDGEIWYCYLLCRIVDGPFHAIDVVSLITKLRRDVYHWLLKVDTMAPDTPLNLPHQMPEHDIKQFKPCDFSGDLDK